MLFLCFPHIRLSGGTSPAAVHLLKRCHRSVFWSNNCQGQSRVNSCPGGCNKRGHTEISTHFPNSKGFCLFLIIESANFVGAVKIGFLLKFVYFLKGFGKFWE